METLVQEDTLTAEERGQAHLFLKQTHTGMLGAIKGMSDAQWQFSPAPERWSIAQITEHAICVLDLVGGMRRNALATAPPPPAEQDYKMVDEIVINQFPTRLSKFPSPPFACPTGRFQSVSEALPALESSYAALLDFLDSTPDLRGHALEAPPLKAVTGGAFSVMDGYQWILAAAAHTERHTKQILEVRAQRGFPNS